MVIAGNGGVQNRVGNANPVIVFCSGQANTFNDDVDEQPVQDLALDEDNTMFIVNLSSANPIYNEADPSYDSDILSEVQDHDDYIDNVVKYHEVHEMQNDVQPNYVVDSDAEYTSDSNIIPYEQYAKDNAEEVIQKMEAEVDQNVVDRKCDEIERKNLLIANENLIANWLTQEVFYTTTDYVLTVSNLFAMHDGYTGAQARCLELEAEISKLKHTIQKDNHSEMIKRFST
nr:hypothetical protein [Tanacetum cinerariifolium]